MQILGICQTVSSTAIVIVFFANFAPLIVRETGFRGCALVTHVALQIKKRWKLRVQEARLRRRALAGTTAVRVCVSHR